MELIKPASLQKPAGFQEGIALPCATATADVYKENKMEVSRGQRYHIGIFGNANSGKSS